MIVLDPATGEVLSELFLVGAADGLPDGRFVTAELSAFNDEERATFGPVRIWDPSDGSTVTIQDCTIRAAENPETARCPDGSQYFGENVRVSTDGSQFAGVSYRGDIRIWDSQTLDMVRTVQPEVGTGLLLFGDGWLMTNGATSSQVLAVDAVTGEQLAEFVGAWRTHAYAVSHDGSRLFLMDTSGRAFEFDTTTWQPVRDWQAQQSRARGISVSPDDARLAVSGEDGLIVIWGIDGDEPVLLDRIPAAADRISDIVWLEGDRMGAAIVPEVGRAEWQVLSLSTDAVVEDALSRLVRSFTAAECATYGLEPCPTLDEMGSR